MTKYMYETGIEIPNILESGSSYGNVVKTFDKNEAFDLYRQGCRNYLNRISKHPPFIHEWWDDIRKAWINNKGEIIDGDAE